MLGRDAIANIYDLADVYHSDNIDRVSDDFIASAQIPNGSFDSVANTRYALPSLSTAAFIMTLRKIY